MRHEMLGTSHVACHESYPTVPLSVPVMLGGDMPNAWTRFVLMQVQFQLALHAPLICLLLCAERDVSCCLLLS